MFTVYKLKEYQLNMYVNFERCFFIGQKKANLIQLFMYSTQSSGNKKWTEQCSKINNA